MDKKLKLSSPWMSYYHKLQAMFKDDPEIKLDFDEDNIEVKMYVDNEDKADALQKLLPAEKVFGSVVMRITVVPANVGESKAHLFETAFSGNPAFSFIISVEDVFTNPVNYVVFKKEVVQYFNDNLGDYHGNCSTLYQDIALEIFGDMDGIFFCTDVGREG